MSMVRRSHWQQVVEEKYLSATAGFRLEPSEAKHPFYLHNYGRFFALDPDAPLLDIGVGPGDLLLLWRNLGFHNVWGIDINEEPVAVCRRHFPEFQIVRVESAAAFLQGHPSSFSVITMFDVLEHLGREEMLDIVSGARQALRPGGCFLVQTINAANLFQIAGRYCDLSHEQSFTEVSLQQAFLLAGFCRFEIAGVETAIGNDPRRIAKRLVRTASHALLRSLYRLEDGNRFRIMTALIRVAAYAG